MILNRVRWAMMALVVCSATTVLTFSLRGGAVPHLPTAKIVRPDKTADLMLRWFGTSTLLVSDGKDAILIDGFFSRPSIGTLGLAWIGLPTIGPDHAEIEKGIDAISDRGANAIFVAHAHHDHVLDTAYVADVMRAPVYGSESAKAVVLAGRPNVQFVVVPQKCDIVVGDFSIKVIATAHIESKFAPLGDVHYGFKLPGSLRDFRSGPNLVFLISHPRHVLLVIPSAIVDDSVAALSGLKADTVLLGVGFLGREDEDAIARYWMTAVADTGAERVHLIHWDNFMRPLDKDLRAIPTDDLARTVRILKELAAPRAPSERKVELSYLPLSSFIGLKDQRPRHE